MSVTQNYKTVTFSGSVGFAIVRSLRQRLESLNTRRRALDGDRSPHGIELTAYLVNQINDVHQALNVLAAADFELVPGAQP